jgi:hypothetical protein
MPQLGIKEHEIVKISKKRGLSVLPDLEAEEFRENNNEEDLDQDYDIAEIKLNHSTSESLRALDTVRSHLQSVGENEALSLVERLEKIFIKLSIEEKTKQTKITEMLAINKLTVR